MNRVFLIGRLSRDPELRHTNSGMAVCQINVAVGRRTGQGREPETDFINVVVWDKQAENVAKYLAKGRQYSHRRRLSALCKEHSHQGHRGVSPHDRRHGAGQCNPLR